jgi:hypothetical protein
VISTDYLLNIKLTFPSLYLSFSVSLSLPLCYKTICSLFFRFPKEIWAPFCIVDANIREERTNNILERCWEDLKKTIQSNNLSLFGIIEQLQKIDSVKMADVERRLVNSCITRSKKRLTRQSSGIGLMYLCIWMCTILKYHRFSNVF